MQKFTARLEIIGINPFVFVPETIRTEIFRKAGKDKGFIPVCGTVNGKAFRQTLVKYRGDWRLYINTTMLKNSPQRIGETIAVEIDFDTNERTLEPHPKLQQALRESDAATTVFNSLPPSRQKEIVRYISLLKTDDSIVKNVQRAIGFLTGKNRFIGRDKP
ncbi:YdeI/OmpD-associated family protein [Flavisolibacter sp. BT320]|nr:YdeI/OmpD-associated family protein [Flavisolibacter longurius]